MEYLIHFFHAGGIFMYPILMFLVLTLAFIVERGYALYFRHKLTPANFRDDLYQKISKGDFSSAVEYSSKYANLNIASARVAKVGIELKMLGAGEEEVQARMDESLTEEISAIDTRTGFLAMFGNVSTLLGLLGTVTGLIASFAGVASASPADRATMLGQGIAEALNTTAFGLVAAIPALIAFAAYQNKTDKLIASASETTAKIFHDLIFQVEIISKENTKIPSKSQRSQNEVSV
jgi:biopolymer transport protein ExbB